MAVCLVFGVLNHRFPSEVLGPSPQAMSSRQLVDFQISRGHVDFIHTAHAQNISYV